MAKKKTKNKTEHVDLRKVPKDKRPKPTTGQSAEARLLPWDAMGADEQAVIRLLDGDTVKGGGNKPRTVRSIEYLSEGLEGDSTRLRARNALRRPVSCGWAERVERAKYRISELGRRRLQARA